MTPIRYWLRLPEPHTHTVAVELEAQDVHGPASLVMPSWTPGSYLMREFARNVVLFEATDGARAPLPFRKTDKNTWSVDAPSDGVLRARWIVNADELSVRTSHVDATHAYINGASMFMALAGREGDPVHVSVDAPEGWHTTTAMEADGDGFRAADFEELVDSPMEIGTHPVLEWAVDGVPHRYAIWGRGNVEPQRLIADTTRIIQAERELWGGLPYPHFTFILHMAPGGGGGLEHRNSTSLLTDRWNFRGQMYESVLGLVAHELFHAWNGKRLRPAVLGPFDLTREAYTRELWVVEGLTTYYTDLVLRRAGIITPQRYMDKLSESITRYQQSVGRRVQPLEDSSFDTWIKFYRPDANSPNATISYYQKGGLVALLMDMEIRERTGNTRSLDDLMRLLWERWGAPDVGFPEGAVEAAASEVAGADLSAQFDLWLRGTGELDFNPVLRTPGLARMGPSGPVGMGPGGMGGPGMGAPGAQGIGGPGTQAMAGPGAQGMGGPGAQGMGGPGAQGMGGPGAQAMGGPGAQAMGGPGAQAMGGPGAQAMGGPGAQAMGGPGAQAMGGPGAQGMGGPGAQAGAGGQPGMGGQAGGQPAMDAQHRPAKPGQPGSAAAAGGQPGTGGPAGSAAPGVGGPGQNMPPPPMESRPGLQIKLENGRLIVGGVQAGSAGWAAGINAGDELLALDGLRIASPEWLNARLLEAKPGSTVQITVFRRDEMVTLRLPVVLAPALRTTLRPVPNARPEQQRVLAEWLRTDIAGDGAPGAPAGAPPARG